MARKRKGSRGLAAFQRMRRLDWLNGALTEIARLEGRLGLLTEEARTAFYGTDYLSPHERLDALYKAQAQAGV